jgi:hypothetical protein
MTAPTEVHAPEAHDVIACELTACILGQRRHADRLELRVDVTGRILAMARQLDDLKLYVGQRMLEALKPLTRAMAKAVAEIEP